MFVREQLRRETVSCGRSMRQGTDTATGTQPLREIQLHNMDATATARASRPGPKSRKAGAGTSTRRDTQTQDTSTSSADGSQRHEDRAWYRKVRYRTLIDQVNTMNDAPATEETVEQIDKVIKETYELCHERKSEGPTHQSAESLLSSKLINATSSLMLQYTRTINENVNAYDPSELIRHIKLNPNYWASIPLPKKISPCPFLYGTFDAGPPIVPQRKERKKTTRLDQNKQTKKPDAVVELKNKDEDFETLKLIRKLIKNRFKANDGVPISYLHLVLDPTSFSRSVENIYHLSFLARDCEIAIEIDKKKNMPVVRPVPKHERDRAQSDGGCSQFIFSIDMAAWKEAVESLDIEQPMIKL